MKRNEGVNYYSKMSIKNERKGQRRSERGSRGLGHVMFFRKS